MARLGNSTDKDTENGKLYFGDKSAAFLKEKSRQAVEDYHNISILFLEIDWINSKLNFYGEMTTKRFVNPQGIQIRGSYKIAQNEVTHQNGIPYKTMKIDVSIYTEQLKELSIEPKRGDYFYVGNRYYQIYDLTINDAGPGQLMMDRERMRCDYAAFEVDDETIQKAVNDKNFGPDINIQHNQTGTVID